MKKIFKSLSTKNLSDFRHELARAHLIISLLSVAIIALLSLGVVGDVTFDATLSTVCIALLSFVIIISLSMSITLFRKK